MRHGHGNEQWLNFGCIDCGQQIVPVTGFEGDTFRTLIERRTCSVDGLQEATATMHAGHRIALVLSSAWPGDGTEPIIQLTPGEVRESRFPSDFLKVTPISPRMAIIYRVFPSFRSRP